MDITRAKGLSIRFRQALNFRGCPECGAQMFEVDRCRENGVVFIWYECGEKDCLGQWLRKISAVSDDSFAPA